ncbi:MAG: hypothetical protein R2932_20830 [Caldilineaceae bacterium]
MAHGVRRRSIEQTSVDLNDVLEEAIMLAQDGTKYESRQVTLNVQETPWPLSPVLGDRELHSGCLSQPARKLL